MKSAIYLDYAAATPLSAHVLDVMRPFFVEKFYNPSSPYLPAVEVRRDYDDAKRAIARAIGGRGDELVITAGATESINLALSGMMGHVVTTSIEHHAVIEAVKAHEYTRVETNSFGRVDPVRIVDAIRPDTTLISVAVANNELGTIQPIRDIVEAIKPIRNERLDSGNTTPLYVHTDASQGVGQIPIHVSRLGVDMMTLSAAKLYGPKQVGALWCAPHVKLSPRIVGGGQERGLRSGTENVAGVIGFAAAIQDAVSTQNGESRRLRELRDSLESSLQEAFPEAVISGDKKHRLPGYLHISFPGIDAERMIFRLEMKGVYVATGSACAANSGLRSHVLEAIGLAPEVADGSIRITLGRHTTEEQIRQAGEILIEELSQEYRRVGI